MLKWIQNTFNIGESDLRSADGRKLSELFENNAPANWDSVDLPRGISIKADERKIIYRLLDDIILIAPFEFAVKFLDRFLSDENPTPGDCQKAHIVYGRLLASDHKFNESVRRFEEALKLSYQPDMPEPPDLIMNYLGVVYSMMGELQKALEAHQRSLEIISTSENEERKAIYFNNLGTVQKEIGLTREAAESFKKALPIMKKLNRPEFLASLYTNIGTVYSRLERYEESLNFQREALKIHRETGNKKEECNALTNIGNILRDMEEYAEAASTIEEALYLASKNDFKFQQAVNLYNLGLLHKKIGEYRKAEDNFNRSAEISEKINDKEGIWRAYLELGDMKQESGDFDASFTFLKRAESVFESMRKELKADRDRVAFLSNQKELLEKIVFLEVERNTENLWGIVQDAKSRSLRELLIGNGKNGNGQEEDWSEEKARELYDKGKLGGSDCIIDFFVGKDSLLRFVYHPDFGLKRSVKKIPRKKIQLEIDRIYEEIKYLENIAPEIAHDGYALSNENEWMKPYQNLYFLLLSDITSELKPYNQLIINPHGALHRLPFTALETGNGPVVRDHSVILSPSLPLLSWQLDSKGSFDSGYKLFMSSPDEMATLTREEGRQLAQMSGDGILIELGEMISVQTPSRFRGDIDLVISLGEKEKFKENLSRMFNELSLFHFAGHGVFDPADPMKSYLKISPDLKITSEEFYRGDFHGHNMKLIALSACETGKVHVGEGDELWGFARALFGSGARSLLLSMWKVEDQLGHDLMLEFYYNLFQEDLPLGQSLGCAQRRIIDRLKNAHPFFWAPYVLYGCP
jgi:tetratricopeptide (TPR) repeat protein